MIGAEDKGRAVHEVKMMPFSECHATSPAFVRAPVLRVFYRAALLGASLVFGATAQAQMSLDPACVFDQSDDQSCAHVIACIGGDDLLVGGAVGWDTGTLYGELSNGARCTGTWNNATAQARFACDDGQRGLVQYVLQDGLTGTAVGFGVTTGGRGVKAWAGNRIFDYIRRETGEVTLTCGRAEIPMS